MKDKDKVDMLAGTLGERGKILAQALPYMRMFNTARFVVKMGGAAMGDDALAALFATDIVLLRQVGIRPIVVHGGGPQIERMLARLKIKSQFIDGLRVTDADTVEIVEMVLSGAINKAIVASIGKAGGIGIGLSGKDADLIRATKLSRTVRDPDSHLEKVLDLGLVGEPSHINPSVLDSIASTDIIPVIAPIGMDQHGQTYNINADTVAGAIAGAVLARRLFLLTDVDGVRDENGNMLSELTVAKAKGLISKGVVSGGMIPKLETCFSTLESGVEAVVIIDGRRPHALLLECFTEGGAGTLIRH